MGVNKKLQNINFKFLTWYISSVLKPNQFWFGFDPSLYMNLISFF